MKRAVFTYCLAKGSGLEIGESPLASERSQEGGGGCAAASDQFSHHLNLRDEFARLDQVASETE